MMSKPQNTVVVGATSAGKTTSHQELITSIDELVGAPPSQLKRTSLTAS